jgi:hypothetical protein
LAFLIQVLAVLSAGAAILVLLREANRRVAISAAAVFATLAAIWSILAFGNQAWNLGRTWMGQRADNVKLPEAAIKGAGGIAFPAREEILRIVDDKIPKQDTVFLVCKDPACAGALNVWITYRLTPRIFTETAKGADWVLLYNAAPADGGLRRGDLIDPVTIEPRYVFARLR